MSKVSIAETEAESQCEEYFEIILVYTGNRTRGLSLRRRDHYPNTTATAQFINEDVFSTIVTPTSEGRYLV